MSSGTTIQSFKVEEAKASARTQYHVPGALFIGIISFYELYIAFSNTMYGEKDFLSKEFFFFILFIFLVSATNFVDLIVQLVSKLSTSLLILFLIYFLISALLSSSEISSEYSKQILVYLPVSFLTGFLGFSNFRLKYKLFDISIGNKSFKSATYFLTFSYIVISLYITSGFLLTLDSRFIQIATETNIYYQDFGDAYIKAAICIWIFQYLYVKSSANYNRSYLNFSILLIFQTILTAVNLVLIGSNKGTALIFLTSGSFLFFAKPPNWLFKGYSIKKRFFFILPILLFILLLLLYPLSLIDITQTRLFDYGNAGSISENSSFTSRFDQFKTGEGDKLFQNLIFGKLGLVYLHSTVASVQTHLGLIGGILLWGFLLLRLIPIYGSKGKVILKAISWPILIIGAISSFFTWDLLWVYFGAIAADQRNEINRI